MFSLVIPYHNRRDLLPRTLRSVIAQNYRPLEVVLVDNGSTDGADEVCRSFVNNAKRNGLTNGISFKFLSVPTLGATVARNTGLQACTAEWVYFFDSDDELSPDFLTDVATVIRQRASEGKTLDLVAAATRMVFPDGRERVRKVFYNASVTDQILCGMLATQGMVVRREFLLAQGGWSASLPYWNDWELGCRLLLAHPHLAWLRGHAYHRIYQHANSITGANFTSRAPLALHSIDTVEQAVRRAHSLGQLNAAQLHRYLLALNARRAILAGHVERENRRALSTTTNPIDETTMQRIRSSRLARFLLFYVAHGGRAAWRIARCFKTNLRLLS